MCLEHVAYAVAARVLEEELPEAEAALPSSTEEPQQSEGTDAAPADESAVPEPEIPTAEPAPEPTPTPTPAPTRMPMFDIIDGRTIGNATPQKVAEEIAAIRAAEKAETAEA